jgi:hypothetical protein
MYFGTKSYLKNTRNHTVKHAFKKHVKKNDEELVKYVFRPQYKFEKLNFRMKKYCI